MLLVWIVVVASYSAACVGAIHGGVYWANGKYPQRSVVNVVFGASLGVVWPVVLAYFVVFGFIAFAGGEDDIHS